MADFPRTGRDREDYARFIGAVLAGTVLASGLTEVLAPNGKRPFTVRVFIPSPTGAVVTEDGVRGDFDTVQMLEDSYRVVRLPVVAVAVPAVDVRLGRD